jgi:hypothetical protein
MKALLTAVVVLVVIGFLFVMGGCAPLDHKPDAGVRATTYTSYRVDGVELQNVRVVEFAHAPIFKAGCTGRPLSTDGQRRRCGLLPLPR